METANTAATPTPCAPDAAPTDATEARHERYREVLTTLESGIAAVVTGDGFARYLACMARFPTYSPNNIALIWTSVPCQSAHVAATLPRISPAPSLSGLRLAMCSTCAFFS